MRLRIQWFFFLFGIISLFLGSPGYPQDKFHLKPGAEGKLCLKCHEPFAEKMKNRFVHTPVKTGECSACHNPHASSHGKLLGEDPKKICFQCHGAVISEKDRSVHKIALEGQCVKCHDPHASNNKLSLIKAGNELCLDCHKNIGAMEAKVKFKHTALEQGCLNCHDPHGSAQADHLLKKDVVSLCLDCHKADRTNFTRKHMNYPVEKANCTSCHNPHGSDKPGMLFENAHSPVENKMCSQCHEPPTSPAPFKTKKAGFELCRGCHAKMVNETFDKNRVHWPLLDKVGCLNCHEPHASTPKKLLRGDPLTLCGKCHADTMARQEKSATKHEPVKQGSCTVCHSPHASDHPFLMPQPSTIEICGSCHDWQKHTTHPIGEKVLDPRNKNLSLQCLSCHRSHGTEYKWMLPFATVNDLCLQCHKAYKR